MHRLSRDVVTYSFPPPPGGGEFVLRGILSAEREETGRGAILMLAHVLQDGRRVENPLGWPVSRETGRGYRYLPAVAAGGTAGFAVELHVAAEVVLVEVAFRLWRPAGAISVGRVRLDLLRRAARAPEPPAPPPPPPAPAAARDAIALDSQPAMAPAAHEVEGGFTYTLGLSVAGAATARAFVLQAQFERADGSPARDAPKGLAHSPRFGSFAYLDPGDALMRFTAPADARRLRLQFHPWGAKAGRIELDRRLTLVAMSEAAVERRIREELEAVMDAADPDGTFLCIYTGTKRIGEANRANRSMMFARDAARLGCSTIYTYSPSEGETEFGRTGDRLLQVPLNIFARIAGVVAARAPGRHRLLIGSMPDLELCRNIGLFRHHGWRYVYECRDEWEEFAAVGSAGWYDEAFERHATAQAERVFCVSPSLQAKMRRYTTDAAKVLVSPNATTDEFLAATAALRPAARRRHAAAPPAQPLVGYFGHLTEQWFDWGALLHAAAALPEARFEIIGFDMPRIALPGNVVHLGSRTHEEIIAIAQRWDVGLIPFKPGRLSRGVDPIKVYEYLALGLKVVSVPMGSLESFPLTFCYDEFGLADALSRAIAHRPDGAEWDEAERILSGASWRLRLLDLMRESGVTPPRRERADAAE
ncbi:glycosyltransferase [Falsiroseomonas sp. CW058]|uniref:glycosyltransferase n=1 Tax=Falsiroseomonas sp. CW058 TaxID=3388664 RepID=UPI003D323D02